MRTYPLTHAPLPPLDLQSMRAARNTLGKDFVAAYKDEVGASEPQEDFDDRNALYSL